MRQSIWKKFGSSFLLFLPAFLFFSLWLIAFFPGLFDIDTIIQWEQLQKLKLNDWHPYIHTLYLGLLNGIWNSPAIVALFQIILSSTIIVLITVKFLKSKFFWVRIASLVLFFVYITSPVIGVYNITLWKDVLFSQLIVLTCLVFLCDFKRKDYLFYILISFLFFLTATMRHNGWPYIFLLPFLFSLSRRSKLDLFKITGIVCLIFIVYEGVVPKLFSIEKTKQNARNLTMLQIDSAIFSSDKAKLTDDQFDYFNKIIPVDFVKSNYNCLGGENVLYANKYNKELLMKDDFLRFSKKIIKTNMSLVVKDRLCLMSSSLGFGSGRYLFPREVTKNDNYLLDIYDENPNKIITKPLSKGGNFLLNKYLKISSCFMGTKNENCNFNILNLNWIPLISILITLFILIVSIYKKNLRLFIIAFIPLSLLPGLFLMTFVSDFRFYLPFYYCLFLVIPACLEALAENKEKVLLK